MSNHHIVAGVKVSKSDVEKSAERVPVRQERRRMLSTAAWEGIFLPSVNSNLSRYGWLIRPTLWVNVLHLRNRRIREGEKVPDAKVNNLLSEAVAQRLDDDPRVIARFDDNLQVAVLHVVHVQGHRELAIRTRFLVPRRRQFNRLRVVQRPGHVEKVTCNVVIIQHQTQFPPHSLSVWYTFINIHRG